MLLSSSVRPDKKAGTFSSSRAAATRLSCFSFIAVMAGLPDSRTYLRISAATAASLGFSAARAAFGDASAPQHPDLPLDVVAELAGSGLPPPRRPVRRARF